MTLAAIPHRLRSWLTNEPSTQAATADETAPKSFAPFGDKPHADEATYLAIHADACKAVYPEIDTYEAETGYAVDRDWLHDLALHTQCVIKKNPLNYGHGRILYAAARQYFSSAPDSPVCIFETGTARGYSSTVMSRAMEDAGVEGHIVTLDRLPHHQAFIWNSIDDHERPKSRAEILAPWEPLSRRITFLEGQVGDLLKAVGLGRIGMAFLDATHEKQDVLEEFAFVEARQEIGDIVVFDDVTPGQFPGVAAAVDEIGQTGTYDIQHISASDFRAYAIGRRIR